MGKYDGFIRIGIEIVKEDFNKGIEKLGSALKGIMAKLINGIAIASLEVVGLVAVISTIAVALIGAGIAAYKFFENLTNSMYKALSPASDYYNKVSELKGAFDAVSGATQSMFSSLLSLAAPVLMKIIDWLIRAINLVSMVIAALAGQKTYMKYISGASQQAAQGTGQAAKNTEKMNKAAKGALAAFDEINVLQMEQPDQDTSGGGGGGSGGGSMMLEETAIESDVLSTVEKIKTWFAGAWQWISDKAALAADWISQAWTNVSIWFQTAWENVKLWAGQAWDKLVALWLPIGAWIKTNVIDPIVSKFNWLIDIVTKCAQQFYEGFIQPVVGFLVSIFSPIIHAIFTSIQAWLSVLIDYWKNIFQIALSTVVSVFQNILSIATSIISSVITVIGGIIEFITGVFTLDWKLAWQGIKDIFTGIFNGIAAVVRGVIVTIITLINSMIKGVYAGINAVIGYLNKIKITIPSWVPIWGGQVWSVNIPTAEAPQIPLPVLATGAVIPPNAKFAAILGDQRNGRNLEAPEGLIRQIIREEIGDLGGDVTVTMPVYLDSEKIYEGQKRVARRRGMSLVNGVTS